MYTYDYNKKLTRCLINKGLFGFVIKSGKTLISNNEYITLNYMIHML